MVVGAITAAFLAFLVFNLATGGNAPKSLPPQPPAAEEAAPPTEPAAPPAESAGDAPKGGDDPAPKGDQKWMVREGARGLIWATLLLSSARVLVLGFFCLWITDKYYVV